MAEASTGLRSRFAHILVQKRNHDAIHLFDLPEGTMMTSNSLIIQAFLQEEPTIRTHLCERDLRFAPIFVRGTMLLNLIPPVFFLR